METKPMTVGEVISHLCKFDPKAPLLLWVNKNTYDFYAYVCSIDEVTLDEWKENQVADDEDLDHEMDEQGLTKDDFPFVQILFYD